jgi:HlyD family secretion protein
MPGFTAVADLEIEADSSSIVVFEKDLIYESDSIFVQILSPENEILKQVVKTGISDGIETCIFEGVSAGQKIVVQ